MRQAGLRESDVFLLGHCGAGHLRGARQVTWTGYSDAKIGPGM